ncbi:hypothetical protein EUX98_g7777 [Antrodiella citrinella]|uniref:Uncharacterized protein n=1 Tax=Antrodiella citrinella TaxID=2447956 RepID=A0A4V3XHS0_9APHY|nr:hypothetical protein EUX98_g7777 [Antrodiella citrinella]
MSHRNVKVVQPGLVYVIEWDAGGDPSHETPSNSPLQSSSTLPAVGSDTTSSGRDKRHAKRDVKRDHDKPPPELPTGSFVPSDYPIYVAYHDWEHFSSIRNLRGPHAGLPNVRETPIPDEYDVMPSPARKPPSKVRSKPVSKSTSVKKLTPSLPLTPSQVPLPTSRSPSPGCLSQAPLSSHSSILPSTPMRAYRSPKRTFDESSASSEESQGIAKRAKPASQLSQSSSLPELGPTVDVGIDLDDGDLDTPSLSAASPASSSSLSSVPSPSASPAPEPQPTPRALTRRQRKQLGLPKSRAALVGSTRASAGKIVIPGGRFKPKQKTAEEEEEWLKNGTGRMDVRGFRELKI